MLWNIFWALSRNAILSNNQWVTFTAVEIRYYYSLNFCKNRVGRAQFNFFRLKFFFFTIPAKKIKKMRKMKVLSWLDWSNHWSIPACSLVWLVDPFHFGNMKDLHGHCIIYLFKWKINSLCFFVGFMDEQTGKSTVIMQGCNFLIKFWRKNSLSPSLI